MLFKTAHKTILYQLEFLLTNLTDEAYTLPLATLNQASVGQHVRHIIEFYLCLEKSLVTHLVNYDARNRDKRIETSKAFASATLQTIEKVFAHASMEGALLLEVAPVGQAILHMPTTLGREVVYLAEHAVHHLALIKIGLQAHFPHLIISEDMGVAASTLHYRTQLSSNSSN